ncbi:MAG: FAD-binding oxidoreductase [Proteobacteria bacterium]|nr:FAD-binding oxidoreductase [Pseudomonadota bacterium]
MNPPSGKNPGVTAAVVTSAIRDIVEEAHLTGAAETLDHLGVTGSVAPAWLVKPGSAPEVAELIRLAERHRIAVIPVGNQARAPRAAALDGQMRMFIDTRRMNHVLHLDETSLIAHVQAGVTAFGLENVLAPRQLSLGDYPPAVLGSTIGGLLSVRTPGKSSGRHGFVEDAVLGLSAVLANGRTIHTRVAPRRSTGPDLARALCGSEGTLGFITSAVLRIHRRPEARFLAAYALPDFDAALSAINLALREEATPAALRAHDSAEASAHFGSEMWPRSDAAVVAATAGPSDLAACDRDLLTSAVEAMGGQVVDEAVAEIWWRRRTGQETGSDEVPRLPALQVTVSPGKQKAVYRAVCTAATEAGGAARGYASRFDRDGAVFFFTFADAAGQQVLHGEELARVRDAAEDRARSAGAVLLDSGNPTVEPYLENLRRALDPNGIMNPHALRKAPPR